MERFSAKIMRDESGRTTYIELPFDAKTVFSIPKGTIYVSGTIGSIPFRGKLISRGGGKQILRVGKEMQNALGYAGEVMDVEVSMENEREAMVLEEAKARRVDVSHNPVLSAMEKRRSIRHYKGEPVKEQDMQSILYAGLCAPTAKNKRPFHFIVLREKEGLHALAETNHHARMLSSAACAIAVCGDQNVEGTKELLLEDCAAAVQNMLLAIHALGLGGVWLGVRQGKEWHQQLCAQLNLPPKIIPVALIALGVPAETRPDAQRYDTSKIHAERWEPQESESIGSAHEKED